MAHASRRLAILSVVLVVVAVTAGAEAASLVFCAPGSPGDTAQAGPTMEQLARAIEKASGLASGSVTAEYHESEPAGIEAIRAAGTLLAAVPVPFFLQHGQDLGLVPHLGIAPASGQPERYALVARKGAVAKPADLDGWEVTGTVGYAEGFVRGAFAKEFGTIPEGARYPFTAAPGQGLGRAAAGDRMAVLLDSAQSASLASLPFGSELAVLARSEPLPAGLVCVAKGRPTDKTTASILKGLERLPKSADGKDALAAIRVQRFEPIDAAGVARLRTASGQAGAHAP
jgi:hypothetical protein